MQVFNFNICWTKQGFDIFLYVILLILFICSLINCLTPNGFLHSEISEIYLL